MIPKKIHYIWLGRSPLPTTVERCIESWRHHLLDFEIIRWDESNLFVNDPAFRRAYAEKKWAFCSDLARLQILYNEGGIYLDTDMEVIRDLTPLLDTDLFMGQEDTVHINGAILAAVPRNAFIRDAKNTVSLALAEGETPIPKLLTRAFKENRNNYAFPLHIYPPEYFYPYNPFVSQTKHLMFADVTPNTYTIHHWGQSWVEPTFSRLYNKARHQLKMMWYQLLARR